MRTACDECRVLRRPLIEGIDLGLGHTASAISVICGIIVQDHPALTPVKHIERDGHVTLPGQFGGDAFAAIAIFLELGQRGMFRLTLNNLLFAPEVSAVVAV